ncbi:MAG: hypothetical protein KH378_08295 [Butyrivibrio sp.]|nr:hypothetical protein [Butyrivibrio sp.]
MMTLKDAHELQRKELISLRTKVARFEKQSTGQFSVEEKEKLERSNRHLQNQLNSIQNKFSRYQVNNSLISKNIAT